MAIDPGSFLVEGGREGGGGGLRLANIAGSGLPLHSVSVSGSQLATIKTDLPVFSEITHHLMICGRDGFHVVQPSAAQYDIELG